MVLIKLVINQTAYKSFRPVESIQEIDSDVKAFPRLFGEIFR